MPKILVSNLPVTTFINATVWYEDGPAETENARIAEAVKAGRWERAHGKHAEDYEDMTLELNEQVLGYPLWSFDVVAEGPPANLTADGTLIRHQVAFEKGTMGCAALGWCEREGRDRAEEERRYAEFLVCSGYDVVSVEGGTATVRPDKRNT